MMGISQFYILSPRGDTIITRDFRGDVVKGTAEIFFRRVTLWKTSRDTPPIFNQDGISYIFLKKNGLYFCCTTSQNISPTYVVELLNKMAKVFKDYCGVLNEESIRKNFILIYEILDEMIDFGYPQTTSTEQLKSCIHNEAIVLEAPKGLGGLGLPQFNPRTVPSNAVHRPVGLTHNENSRSKKNEIFVDILERLTVCLNANGYILNSSIDGSIQMKSYLAGNPELKLALNEDLAIGSTGSTGYSMVTLDDCNFHECVDLRDFDDYRIMSLIPPDGEFSVLNYRITNDFRVPFRIFPTIEEASPYSIDLVIKVRAELPDTNYGGNVVISCAMPKNTTSVSTELHPPNATQAAEYLSNETRISWTIKKFQGGSEHSLRCRINLSTALKKGTQPRLTDSISKEIGPISMNFEIPMYNVSNLQVRYLRIAEKHKSYNPYRWVRYVTQSSSYICRL
eukprot:GEMP01016824.1.p1 GENE.GEMP01016824.1~~GEMP01016824.1.p1  ORF type:complete len:452 (+),score=53.42 GEMP01016824.1:348-1703(+)